MFYQDRVGGLLPDYYVLPAKDARGPRGKGKFAELADDVALHPEITMRYPKYLLGYIFQGLGITHKGVGAHTFRRSVARLYYDRMCDEVDSKDHALRLTQTLLNHSTMSTTEGYIGLEKERAERDITIKGQPIFGVRPENVVPLRVDIDVDVKCPNCGHVFDGDSIKKIPPLPDPPTRSPILKITPPPDVTRDTDQE
jgi:hypothetical protein